MFECDVCNQTFEKARDKKTHITKKHNKANFKCDLCPRSFGYLKNLTIHKTKHEEGKINSHRKIYSYSCTHCPYSSQRKDSLAHHVNLIHLKVKVYKTCDVCALFMKNFVHSNVMNVSIVQVARKD